MLKKWKKYLIVISFIYLNIVVIGCSFFSSVFEYPKFSITKPVYKKGTIENSCLFGGVFFDLYNKSESSIIYFEVNMNVYNKETKELAFPTVGTITLSMNCEIKEAEMKNLCIPLDDYIVVAKDEYLIDQFYIRKICYSDGTQWNDFFGIYSNRSEE